MALALLADLPSLLQAHAWISPQVFSYHLLDQFNPPHLQCMVPCFQFIQVYIIWDWFFQEKPTSWEEPLVLFIRLEIFLLVQISSAFLNVLLGQPLWGWKLLPCVYLGAIAHKYVSHASGLQGLPLREPLQVQPIIAAWVLLTP